MEDEGRVIAEGAGPLTAAARLLASAALAPVPYSGPGNMATAAGVGPGVPVRFKSLIEGVFRPCCPPPEPGFWPAPVAGVPVEAPAGPAAPVSSVFPPGVPTPLLPLPEAELYN